MVQNWHKSLLDHFLDQIQFHNFASFSTFSIFWTKNEFWELCVPKQFYNFHNMNSGAFYYKPLHSSGKRQHPRPSREKWIALEQNQFTFVVSSSCWKILHHGDPEGLRLCCPPKPQPKKQEHLLGKFDNRFFCILSHFWAKADFCLRIQHLPHFSVNFSIYAFINFRQIKSITK